jgi:hypothetical protein
MIESGENENKSLALPHRAVAKTRVQAEFTERTEKNRNDMLE